MTKKGAKKTPALLARQKAQNANSRKARAAARELRFTTPRDGAREETVHKLVGQCIRRMLKRRRNNDARKALGDSKGAERAAAWHAKKRKEADDRGLTHYQLMEERKRQHANKPFTSFNANAYHKKRRATDPAYKVRCNLGNRLREFMRLHNGTKAAGTMELIGCSREKLIAHLQSQLPTGESLLEYSIDHIFPMSLYDATDAEQQRQMMHYTNLQPLKLYGEGGNVSKNNKLPTRAEAMRVERWAWPPGINACQLHDYARLPQRSLAAHLPFPELS